jgi:type IV pilus modification protein PilV
MNTPIRDTMTSRLGADTGGFTLIEVIIALAILTIGILSVNAMQTMSIRGNKTASDITKASTLATDRIERLINMPYDDVSDLDGDGNGPDANADGIDDDGGNFGLDDTKPTAAGDATTADYTVISPDGNFTIVWNVSENLPLPNIKTIHVHVTWQVAGTVRSVTVRHTKSKYM